MENKDYIMIGLPLFMGAILLLIQYGQLKYYTLASPYLLPFFFFGTACGVFAMQFGNKPKEKVLGVDVKRS